MPDFQFESLSDFLAMGGHGFYVWTSYLFFAVVMALNLWLPGHRRVQLLRLLKARQSRQPAQQERPAVRSQPNQQ